MNVLDMILIKSVYVNWLNQKTFDFAPVIHAMCYARGLRSIFELLNAEKQRIFQEYFEL